MREELTEALSDIAVPVMTEMTADQVYCWADKEGIELGEVLPNNPENDIYSYYVQQHGMIAGYILIIDGKVTIYGSVDFDDIQSLLD